MARTNFMQSLDGGQPNWIARIMSHTWAAVTSSETASSHAVTLEVTGWVSGRVTLVSLTMVIVEGERYLVCMPGEDADWVYTVRENRGEAILHGGYSEKVQLEEIPVNYRAPILKAYLQHSPGMKFQAFVNKHAPLTEFEKIAEISPVFHVIIRELTYPSSQIKR